MKNPELVTVAITNGQHGLDVTTEYASVVLIGMDEAEDELTVAPYEIAISGKLDAPDLLAMTAGLVESAIGFISDNYSHDSLAIKMMTTLFKNDINRLFEEAGF